MNKKKVIGVGVDEKQTYEDQLCVYYTKFLKYI